MARLFGALANAGAQYNKGRFAREQYDDQQDKIARDEARRAFEFGVTNDRLMQQARGMAKAREEARIQSAMGQGFEEDLDTGAVRRAGIALDAVTGFQGGAATARATEQKPYEANVEGIPIRAPQMGSQYMTIGGRTLRKDRQRDANAGAMEQERKLLEQFAMKRDVAGKLAEDRAQRQMELEVLRQNGRKDVAALTASLRMQQGAAKEQQSPASEKLTGELATLKDIADQAEYAMSLVQKTKGTAGPLAAAGRFGRKITMQSPTEGDMAAAEYQRVTADLRKKLFGAAQSVRELRSASEFLPMLESSNDQFVANALRGIGEAARKAAENRLSATQAGGRPTGNLSGYTEQFPTFERPAAPSTTMRPDATARPKGAPIPNSVPVPWTTKKGG